MQNGKGKFQLQFLFTDIDHKRQKARELKANIKAEFENAPEWKTITDLKNKSKDKLSELKNRLLQTIGGDEEELKALNKELKDEQVRFRDTALPLLIAGRKVEVEGDDKRIYVAELDVKLVPKEIDEEKDEKVRAEMGLKPSRTKKLKVEKARA